MDFLILGTGAWGTALAVYLARTGHGVTIVPRRTEHYEALVRDGENREYLPGISLRKDIHLRPLADLADAIQRADCVVMACPSIGLEFWCRRVAETWSNTGNVRPVFLSLSKGLDRETLASPGEVIAAQIPGSCHAVLSGPNFAREVAMGQPAAAVLASRMEEGKIRELQEAMSSDEFRFYLTDDVIGVSLGGSLKNIYAIGAGICDGLGLGANAKSALITRSLHEMVRLVVSLGGRQETIYGLSGFGDLVATCFGELSRNRALGEAIGTGKRPSEWLEGRSSVTEGYWACGCFVDLCRRRKISAPILDQIHAVLVEGRSPREALNALMRRELKPEHIPSKISVPG